MEPRRKKINEEGRLKDKKQFKSCIPGVSQIVRGKKRFRGLEKV